MQVRNLNSVIKLIKFNSNIKLRIVGNNLLRTIIGWELDPNILDVTSEHALPAVSLGLLSHDATMPSVIYFALCLKIKIKTGCTPNLSLRSSNPIYSKK